MDEMTEKEIKGTARLITDIFREEFMSKPDVQAKIKLLGDCDHMELTRLLLAAYGEGAAKAAEIFEPLMTGGAEWEKRN